MDSMFTRHNYIQNQLLQHRTPNNTKIKKAPAISPSSFFSSLSSISQTCLTTTFCNIINPPLHPSVNPKHVFTGNFAPVNELDPVECTVVEGELPYSLNGFYIRNGPNPQHIPNGPLHFFEGDGMLHSVLLSQGHAIYCSRYVKTYKYKLEQDVGYAIFPNMLSGCYGLAGIAHFFIAIGRVIAGHIDIMKGFGLANTSLAFFSHKLLALGESDLPYVIGLTQGGDIETLGRWDIDKNLFANMTAHPKVDMDTKETFAFRCSLVFPYLTFFRFNENGVKQKEVPILSIEHPTFIHDFAITKRFVIFPETQLVVEPINVILGRGTPVVCEPAKVPRIGIMPRYATTDSDVKWFRVPGLNVMHVINAWENGDDEVVLVAPNIISIENIFHRIDTVHFSLEKIKINLRTGNVSRNILSTRNLELGCINASYVGKKNRYAYLGVGDQVPKMSGLVKMDLETECEVSRRFYGPDCFGGEPFFVARNEDDPASDEDDGFVVTFVHNENTGESKFLVMDAKSPELDTVAAVKLPRSVPYGVHGLFVPKKNLSNLQPSSN